MTRRPAVPSAATYSSRLAMRCIPLCVFLLVLVTAPARAEWYSEAREKMGTKVEIQLWAGSEAAARPLLAAGMAEFDRIESWMSTYREDSEISRVNRLAAREPVKASAELFGVVAKSLELSALSDGAFDITFDSVGKLYDFRSGVRPDADAIQQRLPDINYRHVLLDPAALTIRFTKEGTRINLGGIGKGYSCERVIELLRKAGVTNALVNAGGDTRLLGDRRGKPWVVGIRDPDDGQHWVTRLALEDEAISTSGDYERYFDEDGVRYHHILDPKSGKSASGLRSVTVIGPDATMTDGLSTSVFVLGPERGLALIETTPGYAAVIIDAEHQVRFSKALRSR
ncbi:MAG: FAD:protein FMN transferase [Chromatiales bacterium]|nr:FAD:protein FMN transferase [Chromatiales bacterium]